MTLHPIDLDLDTDSQQSLTSGLHLRYALHNIMDEEFVHAAYNHYYFHIVMLF